MKTTKKILFTALALLLLLQSCDLSTIFDKDKENLGTEYPSGFVKNPKTGAIYNPKTGATYDPTTGTIIPDGFVVDPVTGKIYNPDTGEVYDPKTGEVTNPDTGETTSNYDPKTGNKLPDGFIIDPVTGKIYNPETGEIYDPVTGKITNPETGETTSVYDPKTGLIEKTNPETGEKEYRSPTTGTQYNTDGTLKKELYYFLTILNPTGSGEIIVENSGFKRGLVDTLSGKAYPIELDTDVTLLFKNSKNYQFERWTSISDSEFEPSESNPFTFTVTGNLTLQVEGTGDTSQLFLNLEDGQEINILHFGKPIRYMLDSSNRRVFYIVNNTELEFKAITKKPFLQFILNGKKIQENPYFHKVTNDMGVSIETTEPIGDKIKLEIEYPLNSADISITSEGENIKPIEKTIGKSTFYVSKDSYVTLVGTPKDNYTFLEWRGDINSVENPLITSIKENTKLVFFTESYIKKISIDYSNAKIKLRVNGIFIPEQVNDGVTFYEVKKNDLVQFEVFPDNEYLFKSWRGDLERTQNPLIQRIDNDTSLILEVEKYYYELGLTYENMNAEVSSGGVLITPYKQKGNKRFYKTPKGVYTKIVSKPYSGWLWSNWNGDLSSSVSPYTIKLDSDKNLIGSVVEDTILLQYGGEVTSMNVTGKYFGSSTIKEVPSSTSDDFAKAIQSKVNLKAKESDKPTLKQIKSTPSDSEIPNNFTPIIYPLSWKHVAWFTSRVGDPVIRTREADLKRQVSFKFVHNANIGNELIDSGSNYYTNLPTQTASYRSDKDTIIELNGNGINLTKALDFELREKTERDIRHISATLRWVRDESLIVSSDPWSLSHNGGKNSPSYARFYSGYYTNPVGKDLYSNLVSIHGYEYRNSILSYYNHLSSTHRYRDAKSATFVNSLIQAKIPKKESDTGIFEYTLFYDEKTESQPEKFVFNKIKVNVDSNAITVKRVQPVAGVKYILFGDSIIFTVEDDPKYYFSPNTVYKIASLEIESKTTGNSKSIDVWLN